MAPRCFTGMTTITSSTHMQQRRQRSPMKKLLTSSIARLVSLSGTARVGAAGRSDVVGAPGIGKPGMYGEGLGTDVLAEELAGAVLGDSGMSPGAARYSGRARPSTSGASVMARSCKQQWGRRQLAVGAEAPTSTSQACWQWWLHVLCGQHPACGTRTWLLLGTT